MSAVAPGVGAETIAAERVALGVKKGLAGDVASEQAVIKRLRSRTNARTGAAAVPRVRGGRGNVCSSWVRVRGCVTVWKTAAQTHSESSFRG